MQIMLCAFSSASESGSNAVGMTFLSLTVFEIYTIDVINVQKIIINVYKRVYNDIFTKRL
jgi:hypothetical protein